MFLIANKRCARSQTSCWRCASQWYPKRLGIRSKNRAWQCGEGYSAKQVLRERCSFEDFDFPSVAVRRLAFLSPLLLRITWVFHLVPLE